MEQSGGSKPIKSAIKRLGNVIKSILPGQDDDEEESERAGSGLISLMLSKSQVERMRNAKKARKQAKKETKQVKKETRAENMQPKAAAQAAPAAAPVAFRKISIPDRASAQQARNDNLVSGIKLAAHALNSPPKGAKISAAANALNFALKPLKAMLNFGKKGPGQSPSTPKRAAAGPKMGR